MSNKINTPILVGVGEVCRAVPEDFSQAVSPVELASQASTQALNDAGVSASAIDVISVVRTWADSVPSAASPFGRSNNPPMSVANRIGAMPQQAIYTQGGGTVPQDLVNEWAEKLADGQASVVLLAGAECVATEKAAMRAQQTLDWSESLSEASDATYEDRGMGINGMIGVEELKHGFVMPTTQYAATENARRAQLGNDFEQHALQMGELFAPFSEVAAANPNAMFKQAYSAQEIAEPGDKNAYLDFPYTYRMVAKNDVNQGAALILTTVERARELGIDQAKWVYLHAYASAQDLPLLERENLAHSKALTLTYQHALAQSGVRANDISILDLYSCFPIAVELAKQALNLDNAPALTQTGGLPFFGGAGSNYAMHAIGSVVNKLRQHPEQYGLVGANGGMIQKHSVGIYSCKPGWQHCDSGFIQQQVLQQPSLPLERNPNGAASIESYTVSYAKGKLVRAVIIGRLNSSGARFVANNVRGDASMLATLVSEDCIGRSICVRSLGQSNVIGFDAASLYSKLPKPELVLRDSYQYCQVKVIDHVLQITINRPEAYNALHPPANEELAQVFDAYMADPDLWVAVITGAGDKAFCAGNDLKYSASGKPVWMPKSGFAGLTSRPGRNKPVIAAVNGVAMGGGLEIALACDVVIASELAEFALPEVKVGLVAAAGGVLRLSREIPRKLAMDLILTGRTFKCDEALALGIINQAVPADQVLSSALEYAEKLTHNSPTSIRLSLQLMNEKASEANVSVASGAADIFDDLVTSEDFYEGPKAFAQKRRPKWTGR